MRIVFFGSGSPLSMACLRELQRHGLVAVVVPSPRLKMPIRSFWRALVVRWAARMMALGARAIQVPVVRFDPASASVAAEALAKYDADLFCIAAFPYLLSPRILSVPRIGTINVHFSLLPRHRGPSPLPVTYLGDDRETGVTIHWAHAQADTGEIAGRVEIPLERGRFVLDLYQELCVRAAALLGITVSDIEKGRAARLPQPAVAEVHETTIDLSTWPAERVWHVLAGLGDRFGPLIYSDGHPLPHARARGFSIAAHERSPGTIEKIPSGYRIYCRDGSVDVDKRSLVSRLRGLVARLRP